jgi:hypothetical protein
MRSVLACLPRFVIFPGLINPQQFAASQNVGGMLHACPTRYTWQSRAVAV